MIFLLVTSYKCLQCDDVPLPSLCDQVGECGEHEVGILDPLVLFAWGIRRFQHFYDHNSEVAVHLTPFLDN